ncbi:MAG: DNA-directed RNA polymerase subunit alpha [Patescibacteria group bacterium]
MIDPVFHTKLEEQSEDYGLFTFEPLVSSFGQSMGVGLRRTLLSSLRGAAVGYVKFDSAPHLFSTIKGVKESALDIVLQLKQLRFEVPAEGRYKISLTSKGEGKIYAKDIEGEVKIVNGDLYIAEITDAKGQLEFEAIVETGYGFVSAEEKEVEETGYITVDSSFSPVRRVNFRVEDTRVGRKTNFERLILEIWTDGSISPQDALRDSTQILAKHFNHILSGKDIKEETVAVAAGTSVSDEATSKLDDIIIDELNLPSRVINALLRENIETVADLIKRGRENLVGLKGVGRKSLDLIDEELKKMNIELS